MLLKTSSQWRLPREECAPALWKTIDDTSKEPGKTFSPLQNSSNPYQQFQTQTVHQKPLRNLPKVEFLRSQISRTANGNSFEIGYKRDYIFLKVPQIMWPVPEVGFKKWCDSRPLSGYNPYPTSAGSASSFHHNNCSIFKRSWGKCGEPYY